MTKKRKKYPNLEQKLERPWCYYCERDFDDLKILISHQKAKHFKCDRCGRRLNTAGGLSVHMNQVHKENLSHVENAIAGRQGLEIEIFGMEGVPADVLDAHNQTVTQKHFAEEAERARLTGNPIRGAFQNGSAPPNKRPKVSETTPDIETRAEKYRFDRQNGTLPDVPPQQTTNTPSTAQQPYPAPFSPANAGFPAPAGAPPVQYAIPGRPSSVPQQPGAGLGALPPRPGFANGDASAMASSLDDLIGQARKEAVPGAPAPGAAEAKEEKKKKSANIRLIFYDESVSPEEKMALLPRFAGFAR